jgi:hypothetical protein
MTSTKVNPPRAYYAHAGPGRAGGQKKRALQSASRQIATLLVFVIAMRDRSFTQICCVSRVPSYRCPPQLADRKHAQMF